MSFINSFENLEIKCMLFESQLFRHFFPKGDITHGLDETPRGYSQAAGGAI